MVTISGSVRSTHDKDGAILLDVALGKMYGLNPVASRILVLLAEGLSENEITSQISHEFSTDLETVGRDVDEFLAQLAAHNLVTHECNGGELR